MVRKLERWNLDYYVMYFITHNYDAVLFNTFKKNKNKNLIYLFIIYLVLKIDVIDSHTLFGLTDKQHKKHMFSVLIIHQYVFCRV